MNCAAAVAVGLALAAAPVAAQTASLANRVAAVREGTVRMRIPVRLGVCGDGRGSVWIQDRDRGRYDQVVCIAGPMLVTIGRANNQTVSIRKRFGAAPGAAPTETDLGEVSATEAARYLLSLAHSFGGSNGDEALSAAAFADAGNLSSEFLAVVRDEATPMNTRRQALFWFGQSDAPTKQLTDLYGELRASSLREQYPFVLSQRRDDAALDKLMEVARSDREFDIRKQALFWLGQSHDPRAVKFLRDLIVR